MYIRTEAVTNGTTIAKEIPMSIIDKFFERATKSEINYDWNNEKIDKKLKMPAFLIGMFIDYYLRYEIAKTHNLELIDFRTEGWNPSCPCYDKYKKANIYEIYVISLSCQVAFGYDYKRFPRSHKATPKGFHFDGLDEWAASLTGTNILLNPAIGSESLQIGADTSLIVDDEIIHFKFTKDKRLQTMKRHFIQLLIYA